MKWWKRLGKDSRGSRPRCVLLVDGNRVQVAERLADLVNFPGVVVLPTHQWMPYGKPVCSNGSWNDAPANEAEIDKANGFIPFDIRRELQIWWLMHGRGTAKTPTWDIASAGEIEGRSGLILVEAKAHENELSDSGKNPPSASANSRENHQRIGRAIEEAANGLELTSGNPWGISRDCRYQLSNRFAWSWKLASLGVPVVLVYLGFLNAQDMANDGPLFQSHADWKRALRDHCAGVVDNSCWGKRLDINGTPLIPLVRTIDQPFDPNAC